MLYNVLKKLKFEGTLEIKDSNDNVHSFGNSNPVVAVKLTNKSIERKLFFNPSLYIGEAYMNEELIIEKGTIEEFINLITNCYDDFISNNKIYKLYEYMSSIFMPLQQINQLVNSKKNVAHHYDIDENLYKLFLDKDMQYSCAYFHNINMSLDQAQKDKKEHIINKLQINENMNVLDIGCGWGGLAFEIARQKQCEVLGISLSENQIKYCKEKAKEHNLDNQVRFELIDYRHAKGKFDRIVSVGMLEHTGKKFYKTYFKKINELLKNDGIGLVHTIGSIDQPQPPAPFIQKYIFPGGVVPSLSDLISPIEKTGLIVNDIETLIRHYDKTLEGWLSRFMNKRSEVKDLFDEKFVKCWEFYLASCSSAFKYRDLVVFQLQLVKNFDAIPSNRRDYIYS